MRRVGHKFTFPQLITLHPAAFSLTSSVWALYTARLTTMEGPMSGLQAPLAVHSNPGVNGFPVSTHMYNKTICGVPTDFSFSLYADRVLLIVTQLGSAGTILAASCDAEAQSTAASTFSISVLLGKRDELLLQLCARQIVEAAGRVGFFRPMLICLGLKNHSMQVVKEVVRTITEHNVWSKHKLQNIDI